MKDVQNLDPIDPVEVFQQMNFKELQNSSRDSLRSQDLKLLTTGTTVHVLIIVHAQGNLFVGAA